MVPKVPKVPMVLVPKVLKVPEVLCEARRAGLYGPLR
jgi:hypothetical protein